MKPAISCLVFFLIHYTISARFYDNTSFGPRMGLNIIPVEKPEPLARNYHLGINAGAFFDYKINSFFSVRTELNYSMRKQLMRHSDTLSLLDNIGNLIGIDTSAIQLPAGINLNIYNNVTSDIRLHYLEIPLLGVLHLRHVKIMTGPYLGILTGARTTSLQKQDIPALSLIDLDALLGNNIPFIDFFIDQLFPAYRQPVISEKRGVTEMKRLDVGIIADITYQLNNNFNFGFRFQHGFIDFRENVTGDKKLNAAYQFLIGYRFGKAKNEGPIIKPRANTGEN
jgi:hypothetical protein